MSFPELPFSINAGDRPEVRQWLYDNGCIWRDSGDSIIEHLNHRYLTISIHKQVSFTTSIALKDIIDPYTYIYGYIDKSESQNSPCVDYVYKQIREIFLNSMLQQDAKTINTLFDNFSGNKEELVKEWIKYN